MSSINDNNKNSFIEIHCIHENISVTSNISVPKFITSPTRAEELRKIIQERVNEVLRFTPIENPEEEELAPTARNEIKLVADQVFQEEKNLMESEALRKKNKDLLKQNRNIPRPTK